MHADPTRINLNVDPTEKRLVGITAHGHHEFDVPYITEVKPGLWQGGTYPGARLPDNIRHWVTLYPWERYTHGILATQLAVAMYDSLHQATSEALHLAEFIAERRVNGPGGDWLLSCQAGLNRSSLVVGYVLLLEDPTLTGDEAVELIRARRSPACLCNEAFERAIRSFR